VAFVTPPSAYKLYKVLFFYIHKAFADSSEHYNNDEKHLELINPSSSSTF